MALPVAAEQNDRRAAPLDLAIEEEEVDDEV